MKIFFPNTPSLRWAAEAGSPFVGQTLKTPAEFAFEEEDGQQVFLIFAATEDGKPEAGVKLDTAEYERLLEFIKEDCARQGLRLTVAPNNP